MQAQPFELTLLDAYTLSSRVKHFIFTHSHHELNYIPGQFITIEFNKNEKKIMRSYSIANPPNRDLRLEFAAGYIENGLGSEYLFHLKPGDTIQAKGPFGRLIVKEPYPKRLILVATSTGVTPYRAMLPQLTTAMQENPELEVILIHGVQHAADLLYYDEFVRFAEQNPRAIYRAQLSQYNDTDATTDKHSIHAGRVLQAFPQLDLTPETDLVYLCGNPNMVDDAFNWLKDQGFAIQQIIREKYISR